MKLIIFVLSFLFGLETKGQISDTSKIKDVSIDSRGYLKWFHYTTKRNFSEQVEIFEFGVWDTVHSMSGMKYIGDFGQTDHPISEQSDQCISEQIDHPISV
jgi:hypothetical protein